MLQLYDIDKNKIDGLTKYKDYCIESVLSTGDKTLSFLYPSKLSDGIVEEGYIRTKEDEFVIKEISTNGEWKSIKARLNVDELEGHPFEHFDTTEQTIEQCLNLALAGTGWTVQVNNVTKKRTIRKTNCSSWDIIQQAKKTYLVEIEFDTINKIIKVAEKLGNDKGVYFMDSLNLRNLDIQSNSYDFYTRIIAIGKDDLKVTVENFQYSTKKKTLIWKDERYTDLASLTEDAKAKLEEISKPHRSYGADVIDLANTSNKYSILSYGLGDTITIISRDKGIREKQRIVKIKKYPEETHRNTCEIANSILSFADVQKEYNDNVDTVNNITSDDGTISEGAIKVAVKNLTVNKLDVGSLNAIEIRVGNIEATSAKITQLDAINASITNLKANKAEIGDLTAAVGRVGILESNVGDIKTLVNGNLTSNNIQSLMLTSDKVTVANGFIKNAMIDNLDVSKINAGDISVNKFRIKSDSGNLLISDNTIQIKDSVRTRVQIGKDASNDYNMYVWDSSGKLMFDATGLKADGIKNKIIRDDMVSDNANINGAKLNISSVVTSINNGTTTLNSSKVLLDGTAQTLNVAFNTLSNTVYADPPSVTTDNSVTKLDGAIDGMLKVKSIKGRTVQNLLKTVRNDILVQYGSIATWHLYKSNTVYTIIVTNKGTEAKQLYLNGSCFTVPIEFVVQATQTSIIKATTLPNFTEPQYAVEVLLKNRITHSQSNNLEIIVLESDWTNKEIPPYFQGIRSVSETGENLFNKWNRGQVDSNNGQLKPIEISYFSAYSDYIRLQPGKKYIANLDDKYRTFIALYDIDKKYISRTAANPVPHIAFDTPTNCYYAVITQYDGDTPFEENLMNTVIPEIVEDINQDKGLTFVTCGKNLINPDALISGWLNSATGNFENNPNRYVTDFIKVNKGTKMSISRSGSNKVSAIWLYKYKFNKTYISGYMPLISGEDKKSIDIDCDYIRIGIPHGTIDEIKSIEIQLEQGETATEYEAYRGQEKLVSLKEPLRSLPNGTRDILDLNKKIVIKNVNKVVLNGEQNVVLAATKTNTVIFAVDISPSLSYIDIYNLICDKFSVGINVVDTNIDAEGIRTVSNASRLYISILKTKLKTPDVVGFKEWLNINPTTVCYQLDKPNEVPVDVDQYMKQYKDGYFITDGSLINSTVEFDYSTSLASAVSTIKEATESNTTSLNIQQGEIKSLISNTTIVKDGKTIQLKDSYNSTVATVDSINSTIGKHTSTIDALTGQITGVDTKVNAVERDLSGVKTSVSNATTTANSALSKATEAKQTADGFLQRVSNIETNYATTSAMNSAITQSATGIKSEVSNTYSTKTELNTVSGKVTNVETRVNTVEQNTTATAITTTISSAINAGTSSISTTQFVMDKTGFTVKNGAIKIQNKAGTNVLAGDINGNLTMVGMITTFNDNMTKRQIELVKNDINFYDWETAENNISIGRVYTGKQVVNGLAISTPALTIKNTPVSYISICSDRSMLMHFDDYNKSTYSGNIPIWFYKNAIMGIGTSMYFNMPGNKGRIFGGTLDTVVVEVPTTKKDNGFIVQSDTGTPLINTRAGYDYIISLKDTYVDGNFAASGSKNSLQKTEHYGERLINAYETAEYFFGDIGSGKIINGECVVYIDDIFKECINTKHQYHIFTQVYDGSITKIERFENHFIVYGVEETEFSWELKAKRLGYENNRLETPNDFDKTESYENMFNRHFEEFEAEKTTEKESVEGDMYTNDTLAGDMLTHELDFKLDNFLLEEEIA